MKHVTTSKKRNPWVEGKKVCPGCNENKSAEDYYNLTSKADGKTSRCKVCVDGINKSWVEANYDKWRETQLNWRANNEGHTYLEKASGYVRYIGFTHPIATPSGVTPYHRVVLFDKIGPGEHECHWKCGRVVSWDKKYPESPEGLVVDHLNGIRDDNRPENLVASCNSCNVGRALRKTTEPEPCDFDGCEYNATSKGLCPGHYQQAWSGKELAPLRRKVMAHKDANGRVCTECDEYKTYENFLLNSNGNFRSKCRKCISGQATKNKADRLAKGLPCSENECESPANTKGLCTKHYSKQYYQKKATA